MVTTKKKAVKKKVAVKQPTVSPQATGKLHIVTGDVLMRKFERKCKSVKMSKSEVARLLLTAFVDGSIVVSEPTAKQTSTISK